MLACPADGGEAALRLSFVRSLPLHGLGAPTAERKLACTSSTNLHMKAHASAAVNRRAVLTGAVVSTIAFAGLVTPPAARALSKKRILGKAGPEVVLDNGIRYREVTVGKGYTPQKGDTVAVHYSLFYDDLEVESSRESQGLAALPLGFSFGAESGPGSAMKVRKREECRLVCVPSCLLFSRRA